MSKIFLLGDCHLGMGYPNNYDKWFKVAKEYFEKFLIPLAKEQLTKDDIIVQLGDLFDNRSFIPIDVLNYGQYLLEELSKICPVHVIVGNHDMYTKSTGDINSLKQFNHIPGVRIYENTEKIEYNKKSILMMPFYEKRKEQVDELKKHSGCDYLFCHSDLNGAKMHLTSVAHRNNDKIDESDFSGYKNVKTGHIHIQQSIGNITFVGSIFQMDRNDYNNQKGIFIIDTDIDNEVFIPNNVSPVFRKHRVISETDIDELELLKNTNDYIDIAISNNLLISNRKLRRKLEMVLEKSSFASIEYIDDIVLTNEEDVEEDIIDIDLDNSLDISSKMDYTDFIKEYISKQKYDSDKFKDGMVAEFDDIIRIYEDNYRGKKD